MKRTTHLLTALFGASLLVGASVAQAGSMTVSFSSGFNQSRVHGHNGGFHQHRRFAQTARHAPRRFKRICHFGPAAYHCHRIPLRHLKRHRLHGHRFAAPTRTVRYVIIN
jgi:hypothetical protein